MAMVDAFRVALGNATIPQAWYDLLEDDPQKRAQWQGSEFRRDW